MVGQNEFLFTKARNLSSEIQNNYQRRYLNYRTSRYNSLGQDGSMLIISPLEYFDELEPPPPIINPLIAFEHAPVPNVS